MLHFHLNMTLELQPSGKKVVFIAFILKAKSSSFRSGCLTQANLTVCLSKLSLNRGCYNPRESFENANLHNFSKTT